MDNQLLEKRTKSKAELEKLLARIKVEHPTTDVDAKNEPPVTEQVVVTPEQRKKKPRHFVTFIERSLPPRDRE